MDPSAPARHLPRTFGRTLPRRVVLASTGALGLIALAGIGIGLGTRLDSPATLALRPAAPAEPGLFEFRPAAPATPPRQQATAPLAPQAVPLAPQAVPLAPQPVPAAPRSVVRTTPPEPARVHNVQRFDTCNPACDSRDPARFVPASLPAQPMRQARSDVPLPPRAVGEVDGPTRPREPDMVDHAIAATLTAVGDVGNYLKGALRLP